MNAHGTSTPLNDRAETLALKTVLGDARAGRPRVVHQVVDRASARRRRRRRGGRHAAGAARPRSRRRRSGSRSPRRASTWTTCRARPARWRSTASARSRCRTASASAATTPCSSWRQHDDRARPAHRREALAGRATGGAVRPGVPDTAPLRRALAPDGRARAGGRRRHRRGRAASTGAPCSATRRIPTYLGGSLGEQHAESIVRVLRLAGRAGAPVVGFIESGGARMQEGLAALGGYARIFREHVALSGRIPQISVICGASAGGGSYSPALTDFVVMTEAATMFLTGPAVVRDVMGEDVDAAAAGRPEGARPQRRRPLRGPLRRGRRAARARPDRPPALARGPAGAGVARGRPARARPGRERARGRVEGLRRARRRARRGRRRPPAGVGAALGAQPRLRLRARSTASPSASSPTSPATWAACSTPTRPPKGARFVRTCNAFGLPLVVLVDTPGFMPGTRQEQGGVIRHGAKLVHAFAEATVPKVTVVLRKAFGGAFIAMNARDLGADYVFAWPQATHRRDGRQPGGRDRPAARHRRRRGPRGRPRPPTRTPTATSTSPPTSRPPRGTSTRSCPRPRRAGAWSRRCGRSRPRPAPPPESETSLLTHDAPARTRSSSSRA